VIRLPGGQAAIMMYSLKKIPQELRRFAVLAAVASIIITAIIHSRDEHVSPGEMSLKEAFQQPSNREQAEGWFIPTPRSVASYDKVAETTDTVPLPRARPIRPGFYYELVRAQGDAEEGEYVLVERPCIPKVEMPKPCYLPERNRRNFPLRRE
jgi:hypothetical protein